MWNQIRNTKYSLFDLSKSGMDLSGLAIKCVSEVLFHKIDKTMEMYKKVLGCKIHYTSKVKLIIDIRHDIVHRNGYTKENEVIDILPR